MSRTITAGRTALTSAAGLTGLIAGLALGSPIASSAADALQARPVVAAAALSGETITEVTGDIGNGFSIHHLNGRVDHPPTRSEARAECGEYRKRVKRVRCRASVNRWHADLAVLRDTIDYYQRLFD